MHHTKMIALKRLLLSFGVLLYAAYTVNTQDFNCLGNWKGFDNACYYMSFEKKNWQEASTDCEDKGGKLAHISGDDVNNFIMKTYRSQLKKQNLWIGVRRCSVIATKWCYSNGRSVVYTNWRQGEPSDSGGVEDCVEMYIGGTWNNNRCRESKPYVCQMIDLDECALGTHKCSSQGTCNNTFGSYNCVCNAGFTGNGTVCTDKDECSSNLHNCHIRASCSNTKGSFNCTCKSGYSGNGTFCNDVNECSTKLHNCHSQAKCTDTKGSFKCTCKRGYSGDGTFCFDIDECFTNVHNCHNHANCINTEGSFNCTCKNGHSGNGTFCFDNDECSTNSHNCHNYASCINTEGSFNCLCKTGYSGNGTSCSDVDECSTNVHNCHHNANCINTEGSFNCTCKNGYSGNGTFCFDNNECSTNSHNCHNNANCINTKGSFNCRCKNGYSGNGTSCFDVDECSTKVNNCHNQAKCTNTDGSFKCICIEGYSGNGASCFDLDECSKNLHNCHNHADCVNTKGSFSCICQRGYSGNGTICIESGLTIAELNNQADELNNKNRSTWKLAAEKIINDLFYLTDLDINHGKGNGTEKKSAAILTDTVRILQKIVDLNISDSSLDLLGPASNILDRRYTETWETTTEGGVIRDLAITLEKYGLQHANSLRNSTTNSSVFQNHSNIQLRVLYIKPAGKLSRKERIFNFSKASFKLSNDELSNETDTVVAVLWYKTLHSFLTKSFYGDIQEELKSEIISVNVRPEPKMPFEKPVRISWDKDEVNQSETCVYWKPELSENRWKSDGCKRVPDSKSLACECYHLTAFASMDISRKMISGSEKRALELISTIGCSLSLFGVTVTILAHAFMWKVIHRNVRSKVPSQVLMNLCVVIGITDILAIMAGPAHDYERFCIAVSILLYFFVLSLFGWMLCEGIVMYFQLVNVFTGLGMGGKHMRAFYAIGWGLPIIVMSVLLGTNDREDFRTKHACWCRGGGALFWTFVATIVLILSINLVIFILALRNALASSEIGTTNTEAVSKLKRVKVGLKGSAILLPLLGLTWVFGLLVFNRDTIAFKYLFAIFNSLQGFVIFVFHVLLNSKVHEAIRTEKKAAKLPHTTYAFIKSSTYDTATGSTSDYSNAGENGNLSTSTRPIFPKKIFKSNPFAVRKKYTIQKPDQGGLTEDRNEYIGQYTKGNPLEKIQLAKL
ncbi:adhesion G protein-coupled receptor E2-like isoform X2 [Dendronephthya gigantea]|uniref:adhesion G protein-coupled receptor E2-like isoform X2 n=1 Tax=Dendronephthya gigantea TaxID=151771 RepID=UPI001069D4C2|nr:adhesion G protein-coupled receptor E2-like isoform X2 [Dendronephthya gigantea]